VNKIKHAQASKLMEQKMANKCSNKACQQFLTMPEHDQTKCYKCRISELEDELKDANKYKYAMLAIGAQRESPHFLTVKCIQCGMKSHGGVATPVIDDNKKDQDYGNDLHVLTPLIPRDSSHDVVRIIPNIPQGDLGVLRKAGKAKETK
jgi:hypothetical protein